MLIIEPEEICNYHAGLFHLQNLPTALGAITDLCRCRVYTLRLKTFHYIFDDNLNKNCAIIIILSTLLLRPSTGGFILPYLLCYCVTIALEITEDKYSQIYSCKHNLVRRRNIVKRYFIWSFTLKLFHSCKVCTRQAHIKCTRRRVSSPENFWIFFRWREISVTRKLRGVAWVYRHREC